MVFIYRWVCLRCERKAPTSNYSATSDRGIAEAVCLRLRSRTDSGLIWDPCWFIGIIRFYYVDDTRIFDGAQATFSNVSLGILSQDIASDNGDFAVFLCKLKVLEHPGRNYMHHAKTARRSRKN
jgi:hypothetical protein